MFTTSVPPERNNELMVQELRKCSQLVRDKERLSQYINKTFKVDEPIPSKSIMVFLNQRGADARNALKLSLFKSNGAKIHKLKPISKGLVKSNPDCFAFPVNLEIEVFENARVVLLEDCPRGYYAKGELGTFLRSTEEGFLEVLLDRGEKVRVYRKLWNLLYTIDDKPCFFEVQQFPIDLGYARSLEDCRGFLFDGVHVAMEIFSKRISSETLLELCSLCLSPDTMSFSQAIDPDSYYSDFSEYLTPTKEILDSREFIEEQRLKIEKMIDGPEPYEELRKTQENLARYISLGYH